MGGSWVIQPAECSHLHLPMAPMCWSFYQLFWKLAKTLGLSNHMDYHQDLRGLMGTTPRLHHWAGCSQPFWAAGSRTSGWGNPQLLGFPGRGSKAGPVVHQNHCYSPLVLAGIPWWISLQAVKVSSASSPSASCCHKDNRTCRKCATHAQTSQSSLHGMKCFSLPAGGRTAQITQQIQQMASTKVFLHQGPPRWQQICLWRHPALAPLNISILCGLDNPPTVVWAREATSHWTISFWATMALWRGWHSGMCAWVLSCSQIISAANTTQQVSHALEFQNKSFTQT